MPNKEKKPELKPFTEEEKQEILRRHKEYVDEMNKYLPDEQKITYDKTLEERINDPKQAELYRIGKQISETKKQQDKIRNDLESRFGKSTHNPDPLSRTLQFAIDPRNTPDAKAYNEQLYRDYLDNPDKIVYLRYKKIMNFNPKEIYECNDDELKLAEFYRDHYPLCDEAFAFDSVVNKTDMTPAFDNALKTIKKPVETLGFPQSLVKAASDLDYFACPKLSMEQSAFIQQNPDAYNFMHSMSPSLKSAMDFAIERQALDTPVEYFGKLEQEHQQFEDGYFVKHRPEKVSVNANQEVVVEEVNFDVAFDKSKKGQIRIAERSQDNLFEIQCMNKGVQREYIKNVQNSINQKMGRNRPFNVDNILDERKGNIVERYILRNTSQEYKDLQQAFKDYNDPQSPNYGKDSLLNDAADKYLDHKGVKDESDLENLKGTSLARSKFALSIRSSLKEKNEHFKKAEENWLGNTKLPVVKEPFLKAEEVEESVDVKKLAKETGLDKENEMDLEDDLNRSL